MAGKLTKEQAEQVYLGARVARLFEDGIVYHGPVIEVLENVPDDKNKKKVWPRLFKVL